jgi:hypothetical protein
VDYLTSHNKVYKEPAYSSAVCPFSLRVDCEYLRAGCTTIEPFAQPTLTGTVHCLNMLQAAVGRCTAGNPSDCQHFLQVATWTYLVITRFKPGAPTRLPYQHPARRAAQTVGQPYTWLETSADADCSIKACAAMMCHGMHATPLRPRCYGCRLPWLAWLLGNWMFLSSCAQIGRHATVSP